MATGKIKFFNETKGYGFIKPDEGGKEIFVHKTGLNENVRTDDEVEYDEEDSKKGPVAVNVSKLN